MTALSVPRPDHGISRHDDERGTLLSVELLQAPFAVRRVFAVTASKGPATRGGHLTACAELIVLVRGSVRVRLRTGQGHSITTSEYLLVEPGQSQLIAANVYIDYDLETADSVMLCLAEAPYGGDRID